MALNFLNNGYFAGKVGIGTESPGEKLEVTGGKVKINKQDEALIINAVSNNGSYILLTNSSTPYAYIGAANQIITAGAATQLGLRSQSDMLFSTGGLTERMRISSAGNVGIGTNSPLAKLDIQGTQGQLFSVTDNLSGEIFAVADISGVPIMSINSSGLSTFTGLVSGITPVNAANFVTKEYVDGGGGLTGFLPLSAGSGFPLTGALYITSDGSAANGAEIYLKHANNNTTDTIGTLFFGNNADATLSSIVVETNGANNTSNLKFNTSNAGTIATALTLQGDNDAIFTGNVGIGDTNPNTTLHVSTDSLTNNVAAQIGDGFVGNDLYHKEGGFLLISGTSQTGTQTGAGIAFQTRNNANTNYWKSSVIMDRDGAMRFTLGGAGTTAGSEDFTILGNGKVGVGITGPTANLQVAGTTTYNSDAAQTLRVCDAGDISKGVHIGFDTTLNAGIIQAGDFGVSYRDLQLNPNVGNIGIGISTTPVSKLQVGSVMDTNTITIGGHYADGGGILAFRSGYVPNAAYIWNTAEIKATDDGNFNGRIEFKTSISGRAAPDIKMVLKASGRLGIGTTGPIKKLDVFDTINGAYATSTQQTVARFFNKTNDATINSAFINLQCSSDNEASNPVAAIGVVSEGTSSNNGSFVAATRSGGGIIEQLRISSAGAIKFNAYGAGYLKSDASGNITAAGAGQVGPFLPLAGGTMLGDIQFNEHSAKFNQSGVRSWEIVASSGKLNILSGDSVGVVRISSGLEVDDNITIDSALLSNQENTDIDSAAAGVVAQVAHATYTAAFFDFVVKKSTNVRSGTVYACHNGDTTPLVEFTETSTQDLGDTSDVVLSVDISGTQMRLIATVASDDWSVKSLIRAI